MYRFRKEGQPVVFKRRFTKPAEAGGVKRLFAALLLLLFSAAVPAQCLTVVYPLAKPPYRATFEAIVAGIAAESPWPLRRVVATQGGEDTTAELGPCPARIGLGRAGLRLLDSIEEPVLHLFGAVDTRPGAPVPGKAAIVLDPAPGPVLERLRHFAPAVRNVHLLFDPAHGAGWVEEAARAASARGLTLIAYETDETQSAVATYRRLLAGLEGGRDALWLGATTSEAEVDAVLPVVLRQAWEHRVVLFSSLPGLARRGVLFSVSPDYEGLGQELARLARRCLDQEPGCAGLHPLTALKTAFNRRTARHLGLALPAGDDPFVDLLLPVDERGKGSG